MKRKPDPAAPAKLLALLRPESFGASLRARWVQAGEFRLHYRELSPEDRLPEATAQAACAVGFVLPKRLCKQAARRNLIRRVARERLRAHLGEQLGEHARAPGQALPVLVLRLQARLDPSWRSAQSEPLRRYLHETMARLLAQWSERWQPPREPRQAP